MSYRLERLSIHQKSFKYIVTKNKQLAVHGSNFDDSNNAEETLCQTSIEQHILEIETISALELRMTKLNMTFKQIPEPSHYENMPMHYTAIFHGCKMTIFS